jgi:uncharacterized membrane protein YedE/YeeE
MEFTNSVERWGEPTLLALGGLVVGLAFGFFAQRSRFCLRAAVIEFWHRKFGEKLSVWLLSFAVAVVSVQLLILLGALDVSGARQFSAKGSLSGALVGGLMFGVGMVLARGCASRLLVLSANGNLRALLAGLVFAVTAQSALSGALAPLRLAIFGAWTIDAGATRDLLALTGIGNWGGLVVGLIWLGAALYFSIQLKGAQRGVWVWVGSAGVGLSIAGAWWWSWQVAHASFEVVTVQGVTFSGPSAEWLMRVLAPNPAPIGFDFGLMPGVFIGSFVAAWLGKELKLEGFNERTGMRRYLIGAVLMGFGAMLAGGCAVGAGVTGGAVFALTAWLALVGMWVGAGLTDRWVDAPPVSAPGLRQP